MAAKAYWLAKALSDRGHEIHVITDAINSDDPYYIHDISVEEDYPHVFIHRSIREVPWIIPQEQHSALSLLDKAFEVIERIRPDVICAAYLVPYGLVGCLASEQSKIPLILHHGGSDINKFLLPKVWSHLWKKYLKKAHLIVTDNENATTFSSFTNHIVTLPPYVPDPKSFTTIKKENNKLPVLAIIGKANYYWRHKGWHRIINIWSKLSAHCKLLILCQGLGEDNFRNYVLQELGDKVEWRKFIHPAGMPSLLQGVDYLFVFEQDLPHMMYSNLAIESLNCGVKLVCESQSLLNYYGIHGIDISGWEDLILNVPPNEVKKAATIIEKDFNSTFHAMGTNKQDFERYIDGHEKTVIEAKSY